jgi:hypothetical protein
MSDLSKKEMDALTRALLTKADKIRALARARVAPADIARFLGIRYQHAYNVVKRSGLTRDRVSDSGAGAFAAGPVRAELASDGRVEIPEGVLRAWGVSPGDEILMSLDGEELRLFTRTAGLRLAQGIVSKYLGPGESLADELLRDRRRETERDRG